MLRDEPTLLWLGVVTLTVVVSLYCMNVVHWVRRSRTIQGYADALEYVEHRYYTRYRLPPWVVAAYLAPVVVLYAFTLLYLFLRQ